MKAEIKAGYNKKRIKLANVLPLDTPFTLNISLSQMCNFKCSYCTHGKTDKEKAEAGLKMKNLSLNDFEELVEQLTEFPHKFKMISITGLGEPLLNPNLGKMIEMIKNLDVAENIELYTNAYCLNEKLTKELVKAGLTKLRISIQGLSSKKYKEISNVDLNFEEFLEKIRYFYENRGETKVYIKIIDVALEKGQEKMFYDIFGDMCDEIYIEHMIVTQNSMGDYDNKVDKSKSLYGNDIGKKLEVCKFPFYSLQVDVEGNVFPCLPLGLPKEFSIGNIKKENLLKIWSGDKINFIRSEMLNLKRSNINVCKKCDVFCYYDSSINECDNLDEDRKSILKRYCIK